MKMPQQLIQPGLRTERNESFEAAATRNNDPRTAILLIPMRITDSVLSWN